MKRKNSHILKIKKHGNIRVFPFLRTENFQNLIPNLGCKSSRNL
ncbi:hypothetical protein LEP1GSC036_0178 [Leptospira weilii str. 2006001853]|uniref:Uncharacterized protein n=1 Tax=Leptospira weilii str. 2006001853 TaxID=1001589 RepID=A0A828Z562_9LEPT|nr:hypothetical protein LEP1GSC036_0178 [Leptospira weilii str. 2006001853]EMJ65384.1 hypothetical protein LEP1GSC051_1528 [Leptospira sp. P2653]EMN46766.1 hypothetical protein LEP1GSC086_0974 [Leptospira weilii str. LNT 1234]